MIDLYRNKEHKINIIEDDNISIKLHENTLIGMHLNTSKLTVTNDKEDSILDKGKIFVI